MNSGEDNNSRRTDRYDSPDEAEWKEEEEEVDVDDSEEDWRYRHDWLEVVISGSGTGEIKERR